MKFVLQTGSMMILARLLAPEDFGVQGMVVAMTGFLGLFRDAGLSMATVQREVITHEQVSTLFWVNVAVGLGLALVAAVSAPALVAFYHEPRLFWVAILSAGAFLFNGMAAQHQALLQRNMRFLTQAKVDVVSMAVGSVLAIVMARLSYGYWALVAMGLATPLVGAVGCWIVMPWLPGLPRRGCGVWSMLRFGGIFTCNSLVVYLAYNVEKILLGRFWGAGPLGVYGRAYQLANLPVQQLNSSISNVAFAALARMQDDPRRLCAYFLKGYSVVLSLTVPVTICCAIFAEEMVRVALGAKWGQAAPIFRLLAPTAMAFALINPFGWFLLATGRAVRSLNIALLIAPVVIGGILAGISRGPVGVAMGYSAAMLALIVPCIAWAKAGTGLGTRDIWRTMNKPLLAGLAASVFGIALKWALLGVVLAPGRLVIGLAVVGGVYAWMLLIAFKQKAFYLDLFTHLLQRRRAGGKEVA